MPPSGQFENVHGIIRPVTRTSASVYVTRSVRDGKEIPSTSAVQRSPLAVACPAVSVPELTISPAPNGSEGNRRATAVPSSARHKAGLFKEFLPDPSSTNSPLFSIRTLNRGSSSTSLG